MRQTKQKTNKGQTKQPVSMPSKKCSKKTATKAKKEKKLTKAQINRIAVKKQMSAFRTDVLKRDGYICQLCGKDVKKGGQVHHWLVGKRFCPSLQFNTDNGVTLCAKCHILDVHRMGAFITHQAVKQQVVKKIGVTKFLALIDLVVQTCKSSSDKKGDKQ